MSKPGIRELHIPITLEMSGTVKVFLHDDVDVQALNDDDLMDLAEQNWLDSLDEFGEPDISLETEVEEVEFRDGKAKVLRTYDIYEEVWEDA